MSLIYFIPGTLCDQRLWSKLWPLLSDEHELINLPIAKTGEMELVVLDLVKQIELASAGRLFSVIGFSLGGYLACALSLHFSAQLERLMVVSNMPKALPDLELCQRKRIINGIAKLGYNGLGQARVKSFLSPLQHSHKALIKLIQSMDKSFVVADLVHHLSELSLRENLCSAMVDTPRPCWFCFGDSDQLVDEHALHPIQTQSPLVNIKKVADSGHFLPLEQPAALAALIVLWLQETI
jgi:pimeloyl-ACP methyl ester carboxylesterase